MTWEPPHRTDTYRYTYPTFVDVVRWFASLPPLPEGVSWGFADPHTVSRAWGLAVWREWPHKQTAILLASDRVDQWDASIVHALRRLDRADELRSLEGR